MSGDFDNGSDSEGYRNYWYALAGGFALIFPVGIPIALIIALGNWVFRRWPLQYWLTAFVVLVVAPGAWAYTQHVSPFETFDTYELAYMTMFFGWLGRLMHASLEQMQQSATAGPSSYGAQYLVSALGNQLQMLLPGLPPFIDASKLVAMPASFFTALFNFLGRREAAERKRQSGVVVEKGGRVVLVQDKANVAGPITMAESVAGSSFSNATDAGVVMHTDKHNSPTVGDYVVIETQAPQVRLPRRQRRPWVPKAVAVAFVFVVAAVVFIGFRGTNAGPASAAASTASAAAFQPFWVRNHGLTELWSGPSTQSGVISFGMTSAESCVFLVVEPPVGGRWHVLNPYSENYAWIDAAAVVQTDAPANRPNEKAPDQNCASDDVR